MDSTLVTALVASGSALLGGAVAHWGAAQLQAQRLGHEAQLQTRALQQQKREEFVGWVLTAQERIEGRLASESHKTPLAQPAESARFAARCAYAVALLYLADVRPLAKALYESATALEALLASGEPVGEERGVSRALRFKSDVTAIEDASAKWQAQPCARPN